MSIFKDELKQLLQRRLEAHQQELRANIRHAMERRDAYECIAGEVPDAGDSSVANTIVDLARVALDRDLVRLRALDEALRRFRDGNYGLCINCSGEIPVERLYAQLTAERCVTCQAIFEKKRAGYRNGAVA